jgi:hypothetical protein
MDRFRVNNPRVRSRARMFLAGEALALLAIFVLLAIWSLLVAAS